MDKLVDDKYFRSFSKNFRKFKAFFLQIYFRYSFRLFKKKMKHLIDETKNLKSIKFEP